LILVWFSWCSWRDFRISLKLDSLNQVNLNLCIEPTCSTLFSISSLTTSSPDPPHLRIFLHSLLYYSIQLPSSFIFDFLIECNFSCMHFFFTSQHQLLVHSTPTLTWIPESPSIDSSVTTSKPLAYLLFFLICHLSCTNIGHISASTSYPLPLQLQLRERILLSSQYFVSQQVSLHFPCFPVHLRFAVDLYDQISISTWASVLILTLGLMFAHSPSQRIWVHPIFQNQLPRSRFQLDGHHFTQPVLLHQQFIITLLPLAN